MVGSTPIGFVPLARGRSRDRCHLVLAGEDENKWSSESTFFSFFPVCHL